MVNFIKFFWIKKDYVISSEVMKYPYGYGSLNDDTIDINRQQLVQVIKIPVIWIGKNVKNIKSREILVSVFFYLTTINNVDFKVINSVENCYNSLPSPIH